jgi:type IV pilus assembly protein PilM
MFGFGFGKNIFLGVDIGTSSIKIVEIKESSGRPVLSNYAQVDVPESISKDNSSAFLFESVFPGLLKEMFSQAGIKSEKASLSIPAFGGLVTLIEFPRMSKEDMEQAIRFEAQKYIPMSLNDVVLSWDTFEKEPPSKKKGEKGEIKNDPSSRVKTILVAASKSKVMAYEKLAKEAGITLDSIELESFSMVRSLVGNDEGNFIIVDMGSRICNIILVRDGMISLSRNIDAGGTDITKTIAKSLGIDEERAELLKVSGRNLFEKESFINFPSLELILAEINRVIKTIQNEKNGTNKIDGVILSGGTANLTGIKEYFSRNLEQNVLLGDPFGRVDYPKKLENEIRKKGLQFTVSLGLAIKGFNNRKK